MTTDETTATAVRDRGRFFPRRALDGEIERHRLDQAYAAAAGRVAIVVAPAGYGKSTLVARWTRGERRPLRWLDLEPVDDDQIELMRSLTAVMSQANGRQPSGDDVFVAQRFDRALTELAEPIVLVVDDVEHVRNQAAGRVLQRVATSLGPDSTLVLIGRDVHEHLTAELRLSPGTVELGAEHLAFDDAETAQLIERRLAPADAELFAPTAHRFEGWPAGLALAIGDLGRTGFDGGSPPEHVVAAVWLEQLDRDDRDLLGELACLGRFHPDMCREVLGRSGCRADLRRLRRRQFVLDALDQRGDWYRLHPIVGDWLRLELRSDRPDRWAELHANAADWWERHGDHDLAFEFAHLMGDVDRCIAIIAEHGGPFVAGGRHRTVRRWLEALGEETIRSVPDLCGVAAVVETQVGDFVAALRWTRALSHGAVREPSETLALQAGVLAAAFETSPTHELRPALEESVRRLPAGAWRAFGCWALGGIRHLGGDVAAALDILDEGAFEARVAEVHRLEANNIGMRATVRFLEGDTSATADAVEALRTLERSVPDVTAPSVNLVAMVALHDALAGRRDVAVARIDHCIEMLSGFGAASPWFHAYTVVVLAHASLLVGNAPSARGFVDRASGLLRHEVVGHGLTPHLDDLATRVAASEQLGLDPAWSLTSAELGVLRYLPTNLSLADIAAELFVSRNTVKSHTAAIYRKLGTTSRAETVASARAAGLLAEHGR